MCIQIREFKRGNLHNIRLNSWWFRFYTGLQIGSLSRMKSHKKYDVCLHIDKEYHCWTDSLQISLCQFAHPSIHYVIDFLRVHFWMVILQSQPQVKHHQNTFPASTHFWPYGLNQNYTNNLLNKELRRFIYLVNFLWFHNERYFAWLDESLRSTREKGTRLPSQLCLYSEGHFQLEMWSVLDAIIDTPPIQNHCCSLHLKS